VLQIDGETPLIMAVKKKNIEIVRLLLSGGRADVNQPNDKKETALLIAVGGGSRDGGARSHSAQEVLVRIILESPTCALLTLISFLRCKCQSRININAPDADGNTALMHACRLGIVPIVQLLMRVGVGLFTFLFHYSVPWMTLVIDIQVVNKLGKTCLDIAADMGQIEVCWLLKNFGILISHLFAGGRLLRCVTICIDFNSVAARKSSDAAEEPSTRKKVRESFASRKIQVSPARIRTRLQSLAERFYGSEKV
jgi:hypothetical protein